MGSQTKLATGVERIAGALASAPPTHLAVVDSASLAVTELGAPGDLIGLPLTGETDALASLPAMFEVATEHLKVGGFGRAEIWVCSDGQSSDWQPEDGRWPAIEQALVSLPAGIRVNLLNFSASAPGNASVRVERAERETSREGNAEQTELVLDLLVRRTDAESTEPISVVVDLAGARSVVSVEMSAGEGELRGHRIPIEQSKGQGWGFVELGSDANQADNRYYFTFGRGEVRETVVVWEEASSLDVLRFAAEAPTSETTKYLSRAVPIGETGELDLIGAALLIWQGPLPQDEVALTVEHFLGAGGRVLFLPPAEPRGHVFQGIEWDAPRELVGDQGAEPAAPSFWRDEDDLLHHGEDGTPLTVKELRVSQLTPAQGDLTRLAGFATGETLLSRAPTARGGLYFLGTSPAPSNSNLAIQGVVLVAMVQRALEAAALDLGTRGQQDAGAVDPALATIGFQILSESKPAVLLSEQLFYGGVLQSGENLVAVNRALAEDRAGPMADESLTGLMPQVDLSLVTGGDKASGLVEEIWRVFLFLLLGALLFEAMLCLTESSGPVAKKGPKSTKQAANSPKEAA